MPRLENHRTPTTVYSSETTFDDVARYCIVLPRALPVQRFLLAAYLGSWSAVSTAAVVNFDLWKRCYYPNVRDRLIAKVCTAYLVSGHRDVHVSTFVIEVICLRRVSREKCYSLRFYPAFVILPF